jgi:hypothetical protein
MTEDSYLRSLVVSRCKELGSDTAAAEFFGVQKSLIRQWVAGSKPPSLAAVERVFVMPPELPKDAEWAGKDVFLAMPSYKTTNPLTLYSILGLWDRAKFGGNIKFNDAYIIHARNLLAHDFLATGLEGCFWIDDDMVVPMGSAGWFNQYTGFNLSGTYAGLHTVNRLRSHGKSLVGALYYGRNPSGRAMYYEALLNTPEGNAEDSRAHQAPRDELKATRWFGSGCFYNSRQVLLDIKAQMPHLAPQHPSEPWGFFSNSEDGLLRRMPQAKALVDSAASEVKGGSGEKAAGLLADLQKLLSEAEEDTKRNNRLHQGEDQTFGIRAGQCGHQPYVDMAVVCGHIGSAIYGPHNTKK